MCFLSGLQTQFFNRLQVAHTQVKELILQAKSGAQVPCSSCKQAKKKASKYLQNTVVKHSRLTGYRVLFQMQELPSC